MGNSPGLRSTPKFRTKFWFRGSPFQMPERSGLPSGFLGAGAERSGLPSLVRGIPLVGTFSHCAAAGKVAIITAAESELILRFIVASQLGLFAHKVLQVLFVFADKLQ